MRQDAISQSQIADLLKQGIAAVKIGEREKGRSLLMQVIEADERIEAAWLWLSGAVDSDDDRRICLENVLAINPNNTAAQKGLARLGPAPVEAPPEQPQEIVVRHEHAPNTPAAAILYPDRQADETIWRDTTPPLTRVPTAELTTTSKYDDVWNSDKDLCPFCAGPIAEAEDRCPQCRRSLIETSWRNPRPTANFHILWVLLVGLAQLSLAQLVYGFTAKAALITQIVNGAIAVVMLILAVGLYLRKRRAYLAAMGSLPVVFVIAVTGVIAESSIAGTIAKAITKDPTGTAIVKGIVSPIVELIFVFVRVLQVGTALGAFVLGLLAVSHDFERVKARLVAQVDPGLREAAQYYGAGQKYARREMWASAILNWQRAAAKDPAQIAYQRSLGEAYARLGFYERSLDVLQSARRIATQPATIADLDQLIESVRQRQAARIGAANRAGEASQA